MDDYITRLDKALCRYTTIKTRQRVISDYREFYETLRNEGKTDVEIEQKLGDPVAIAKEIAAEDKGTVMRINKAVVLRIIIAVAAVVLLVLNILTVKESSSPLDEMMLIFLTMCGQTAAFTYLAYVLMAPCLREGYKFLRLVTCIISFCLGELYTILGIYRILCFMSSGGPIFSAFVYAATPLVFAVVIDIAALIIIAVMKRRKYESAA